VNRHASRVRVFVGLAALIGVLLGRGGKPLLQVGVVGTDMDQRVFLIKPDVCDLFLLGKPCSHKLSFLRPRLERGAFLREFSRLLTWGKWGFSNRNRPGEPFFVRAVPIAAFSFFPALDRPASCRQVSL